MLVRTPGQLPRLTVALVAALVLLTKPCRADDGERLLQTAEQALSGGQWEAAARALAAAETLPATGDFEHRLAACRRDLFMVVRLDEIRGYSKDYDSEAVVSAYQQAFHAYGLAPERATIDADQQAVRTSRIRAHLLAALDDWACAAADDHTVRCQLLDFANGVDDSTLGREVRAAAWAADRPRLLRLAKQTNLETLPSSTVLLLATVLDDADETMAMVEVLRRAQRRYPADFSILLALGTALLKQYPLHVGAGPQPQELPSGETVRCFRAACSLRPDAVEAQLGLCYVLVELHSYLEAETAAGRAVHAQPNWDETHLMLGVALNAQGKYTQARAACYEALRWNGKNWRALSILGIAFAQEEKWDDAVAAFRRALALEKNNQPLLRSLGVALANQEKYEEAEPYLREASSLDADDWTAHYQLGWLLCQRQRFAEAEPSLREAIRLNCELAPAHAYLETALLRQGRPIDAEQACREALRLDPTAFRPRFDLGAALVVQKRFAEAEAIYRDLLRKNDTKMEVWNNLVGVLHFQNKASEAENVCREGLKHLPHNAALTKCLGDILALQHKNADAEAAYREAIQLDDGARENWLALLRLLAQQNKVEEVETLSRQAVQRLPNDAWFYCFLAVALATQHRDAEADTARREAIRLDANLWKALVDKTPRGGDAQHEAKPGVGTRP
jgi:Flp pilus assembly protein TadD